MSSGTCDSAGDAWKHLTRPGSQRPKTACCTIPFVCDVPQGPVLGAGGGWGPGAGQEEVEHRAACGLYEVAKMM